MSGIVSRRILLRGLLAAPAVVISSNLMPVRGIILPIGPSIADLLAAGHTFFNVGAGLPWRNGVMPVNAADLVHHFLDGVPVTREAFHAVPDVMSRPWTIERGHAR